MRALKKLEETILTTVDVENCDYTQNDNDIINLIKDIKEPWTIDSYNSARDLVNSRDYMVIDATDEYRLMRGEEIVKAFIKKTVEEILDSPEELNILESAEPPKSVRHGGSTIQTSNLKATLTVDSEDLGKDEEPLLELIDEVMSLVSSIGKSWSRESIEKLPEEKLNKLKQKLQDEEVVLVEAVFSKDPEYIGEPMNIKNLYKHKFEGYTILSKQLDNARYSYMIRDDSSKICLQHGSKETIKELRESIRKDLVEILR